MSANLKSNEPVPRQGYIPVKDAGLYVREIGQGQPIIVLHGGPDFDHTYLLPDMDRLSASFHLIYYDQRGRGKSAAHVQPDDISIESEIQDLEAVREYFQLESVAVLGHSWGGLIALEYALRHPQRVSHLVLMNSAPVSHEDYILFRQERRRSAVDDVARMKAMSATAGYMEGDPNTVADYYRVHFKAAIRQPEHLEQVVQSLRLSFTQEGIFKARAIEDRLLDETWLLSDYNLLPQIQGLDIPTLVLHGEYDFIPVECASHIAGAIPDSRFVLLKECGHFAYLECPYQVRQEINGFFHDR